MKLARLFILILMFVGFSSTTLAANLKIGVVNIAKVMDEAPQAGKARDDMQKEFAPREQELVDTQKKIRSMEENLTRNGSIMSESKRSKMERDVLSMKRDFQRDQEAFRDDLNYKRNEILQRLQRDLVGIIQDYAKKQKFDLLLADGVVYASETLDVTEQVLTELRKKAK